MFRISPLFLILGILVSSILPAFAQEESPHKIGDLIQVDWRKAEIKDSISLMGLKERCLGGHEQLFAAIEANPDSFPMQVLEDPEREETATHRRWEYQMKRMPVRVVQISDVQNHLQLNLELEFDTITFCNHSLFTVSLQLKNIREMPLPEFAFGFKAIQGINLLGLKAIERFGYDGSIQKPSRKEFRFYLDDLEPEEGILMQATFVVDCNGSASSAALSGEGSRLEKFEYVMEWSGYQLDYEAMTLYKVINKGTIGNQFLLKSQLAN